MDRATQPGCLGASNHFLQGQRRHFAADRLIQHLPAGLDHIAIKRALRCFFCSRIFRNDDAHDFIESDIALRTPQTVAAARAAHAFQQSRTRQRLKQGLDAPTGQPCAFGDIAAADKLDRPAWNATSTMMITAIIALSLRRYMQIFPQ